MNSHVKRGTPATIRKAKAARLVLARSGAGYGTTTAGAAAVNSSISTYTQHENGTRSFGEKAALRYAAAFNVSAAWLIFGDPGDVQPHEQAHRVEEARESGSHDTLSRASDLREYLEEAIDLLHALDKIGDGIGGADGYSVSAVALAAKSVADNALDAVKAMERAL